MIEWMKRFFGQTPSSSTAKERLRLVLMTDHLALAPDIIENMKRDLVDVISRYVEVDREKVEVNFEREDRALAMLANIPIVSVARPACHPERSEPGASVVEGQAEGVILSGTPEGSVVEGPPKPATASMSGPPPTRRRRRKKPAQPKTAPVQP